MDRSLAISGVQIAQKWLFIQPPLLPLLEISAHPKTILESLNLLKCKKGRGKTAAKAIPEMLFLRIYWKYAGSSGPTPYAHGNFFTNAFVS
jgi:hypothetical protein